MSDSTIKQILNVFPVNAEALKPEPTLQGHRQIVRDFSLNTSTHGIPGIARSHSIHNCIFWSISFVVFTGVTLYFITEAILAYYAYPTQTSVGFSDEWPQAFPAVTICNYSPFRYDQFIGPYLNYTNAQNLTNTTDTSAFTEDQASYINDFLQYKLNQNESLSDFYYPLSSMLIKCVYNDGNCSAADFVQFQSPTYGLCYIYNSQANNINNDQIHYNNENGDSGKLELDLYVHSHEYVPFLYDGVGLVTMIHDNTQLPLIERAETHLEPGRKHKIGYTKQTKTFLASPYTTCSDKVTAGMQAVFDQFSGATYTYDQESCFKVALQTYTYIQCGCVSPFEWANRYIILPGTTNVIYSLLCNVSDPCYSEAATRFQSSSAIAGQYGADCGLECSTVEFVNKLSSVSAPPQWRMQDIKEFVESSSIPLPSNWSTTWSTEILANYVGLSVVCESTRVESYTQQAALGAVDVISNVGGQTGLWIGISFLSLMEVAEMLYRLIRHQYHIIRAKIRKQTFDEKIIETTIE